MSTISLTLTENAPVVKLTDKDYQSDQEVRWCPGCGDYAILRQMQKLLADLDIPRHKHVFVSGIGCSSRFPYYMNTYGFHTIHGRAPAFATGIKCVQPDLTVWFDLAAEEAAKRLVGARVPDKFEAQPVEFFRRVAQGYAGRLQADPQRFARIDASLPRDAVWLDLKQVFVAKGWLP